MIGLLVNLLIVLVILGAVYWIGTLLLGMVNAPAPLGQIFHIVFVVICVIALLYFLLHVLGAGWPAMGRW
jgi:hypothetical protein